jgi:hypothetical protein
MSCEKQVKLLADFARHDDLVLGGNGHSFQRFNSPDDIKSERNKTTKNNACPYISRPEILLPELLRVVIC